MAERLYRVTTLGCRVNRADSLAIESEFESRGYRPAGPGEHPEFWVVNTCAVTSEAMRKSRKAVRRCASSGARTYVTGCASEAEPETFRSTRGVSGVVPNSAKQSMVSRLEGVRGEGAPDRVHISAGMARVPVKVQDGCTRFCTYCIVPYLRGVPASRPSSEVVAEVEALKDAGAGEVILCGIDLGSYEDPSDGSGLGTLAGRVIDAAGGMWVRLSSLELEDVDDALLELMDPDSRLCRHLHVPLQSGDPLVLEAMGRGYSPGAFLSRVGEIRDRVPGISVTTDVMVGFPGETEAAFEATRSMLRSLSPGRTHVFRYSRRPGTAAADLDDDVTRADKESRAALLRELGRECADRFHHGYLGRIIPVLAESFMDDGTGRMFGRTEGFAPVVYSGARAAGEVDVVRVTGAGPEALGGEAIGRGRESGRGEPLG